MFHSSSSADGRDAQVYLRLITRRPHWLVEQTQCRKSLRRSCEDELFVSVPARGDTASLPGLSPWESLPPHIWFTEYFLSCPCIRIMSINLQRNICARLYFSSLSLLWFGVCSLGLHHAAKSLQIADVFVPLWWRAGDCRTAGTFASRRRAVWEDAMCCLKAIKDLSS